MVVEAEAEEVGVTEEQGFLVELEVTSTAATATAAEVVVTATLVVDMRTDEVRLPTGQLVMEAGHAVTVKVSVTQTVETTSASVAVAVEVAASAATSVVTACAADAALDDG